MACVEAPHPLSLAPVRSTHGQVPPRGHAGLPRIAKALLYLLEGASETLCGETLYLEICSTRGRGQLLPLQAEKLRKHRPREGTRILEGIGGGLRSSAPQEREAQGGRASSSWPPSHTLVQPTCPPLPPVNY